ncbi:MAG: lipoyl(octanoyl) transferase LipB [Terriglobales bacterium]|jgi:lipoyl(octanoyl) transferase
MISVIQLGTVDYETAVRLQRSLVELRHSGRIPNVLLLLEHPPVITMGRNANQRNVLAVPDVLKSEGVAVFECDRGGDVTYHGPGQLVGYPIFDLRSFRKPEMEEDIPPEAGRKTLGAIEYVRRLEEALIRTCADLGVAAARVPKLTGVWTTTDPQAKIAAIGVHISRGITSHGFALNVNTDLRHFGLIVPCGIQSKPVTSLSRETRAFVSMDTVAESVARNFGRVFQSQILWVETLDALLGRSVDIPLKAPEEMRGLHGDEVSWA